MEFIVFSEYVKIKGQPDKKVHCRGLNGTSERIIDPRAKPEDPFNQETIIGDSLILFVKEEGKKGKKIRPKHIYVVDSGDIWKIDKYSAHSSNVVFCGAYDDNENKKEAVIQVVGITTDTDSTVRTFPTTVNVQVGGNIN